MAAGAKPSVRITAAVALLNSRPTEDSTADSWPFAGSATDGWDGQSLPQAVAVIASARTTIIRAGTSLFGPHPVPASCSSSQSKRHTPPWGRDGRLKVAAGETFRHTAARLSEEPFSL
jgi:hypothetical protein